jgi:hypothetical protein
MSTADWSAVDVAKGVDKSISIGSSSVSYLASAARFVASAAGAMGDIYASDEEDTDGDDDDNDDGRGGGGGANNNKKAAGSSASEVGSGDDGDRDDVRNADGIDGGNLKDGTVNHTLRSSRRPDISLVPSFSTHTNISGGVPHFLPVKRRWPVGSIAVFDMKLGSRRDRKTSLLESRPAMPVTSIAPPANATVGMAVAALSFSSSGNMLAVAPEDGREIYVYALLHSVLSSSRLGAKTDLQSAPDNDNKAGHNISISSSGSGSSNNYNGADTVTINNHKIRSQLMYRLQRGVTRGVIEQVAFDQVGKFVFALSGRGTAHLFAINPARVMITGSETATAIATAAAKRIKLQSGSTAAANKKAASELQQFKRMCRREPRVVALPATAQTHCQHRKNATRTSSSELRAASPETVGVFLNEEGRESSSSGDNGDSSSSTTTTSSGLASTASKGLEVVSESLASVSRSAYQALWSLAEASTCQGGVSDQSLPGYIRALKLATVPPKVITVSPLLRLWNPPPAPRQAEASPRREEGEECHSSGDGGALSSRDDASDESGGRRNGDVSATNAHAPNLHLLPEDGRAVAAAFWSSEDGTSASHLLTVSSTGRVCRTWFEAQEVDDASSGGGGARFGRKVVGDTVAAVGAGLGNLGVGLGLMSPSSDEQRGRPGGVGRTSGPLLPSDDGVLELSKREEKTWELFELRSDPVPLVDAVLFEMTNKKVTDSVARSACLSASSGSRSDGARVEWLSRMEVRTFSPKEAPIWGRPNLKLSTLCISAADGDSGGEADATRNRPWWWNAPMPGKDTETKRMGSAAEGTSDLEGSIRAAMEVPMFPTQ